MAKIIQFPAFLGPVPPPPPLTPSEQLLAMLDAERRNMRARWRREGRIQVPTARRITISVCAPPSDDVDAMQLWELASALLLSSEAMFNTSVRLDGKSDKVLKGYVRAVTKLLRQVEVSPPKPRRRRRRHT